MRGLALTYNGFSSYLQSNFSISNTNCIWSMVILKKTYLRIEIKFAALHDIHIPWVPR